jgi:hypothetical protein
LRQIPRQRARRADAGTKLDLAGLEMNEVHVVLDVHFQHGRALCLCQRGDLFEAAQLYL